MTMAKTINGFRPKMSLNLAIMIKKPTLTTISSVATSAGWILLTSISEQIGSDNPAIFMETLQVIANRDQGCADNGNL